MMKSIPNVVSLLFIYCISNFLFLINQGIYWDDWALFNMNPDGIMHQFKGNGLVYMGYIHIWLQNLTSEPAMLYHALTFLLGACTMFLYYKTIGLVLNKQIAFVTTLIMITIPFNLVIYYMICLPYCIGLFFQVLACYLIIKTFYCTGSNFFVRCLVLPIQFLAYMFLPSTLVFSLVFITLVSALKIEFPYLSITYLGHLITATLKRLELILLPFFFLIIRSIYWSPSGIYKSQGYNEMGIKNIILYPIQLVILFFNSIFELLQATSLLQERIFFFILLLVFGLVYIVVKNTAVFDAKQQKQYGLLFASIVLFVGAVTAYLLVGKYPTLFTNNSRHQALMVLSTPLFFCFILALIKKQKVLVVVLISILTLFIGIRVNTGLQFIKSHHKQVGIEMVLKNSEYFKTNVSNMLIVDKTTSNNEFTQEYAFYCWTGISKKATGKETRFITDFNYFMEGKTLKLDFIKNNATYNMTECSDITQFDHIAIVEKGKKVSSLDCIVNIYYCFINRELFCKRVEESVYIKILKYQ